MVNGTLQRRSNSQLYNQNYPTAPSYVGASIFTQDCAVSGISMICVVSSKTSFGSIIHVAHSSQALPSFFQSWLLNGTMSLCNDPVVPSGEDEGVAQCSPAQLLCASADTVDQGAAVTLQTCSNAGETWRDL